MTRDDIIRMAREANFYQSEIGGNEDGFVHFAALVAAHTLSNIDPSSFMSYQEGFAAGAAAEREACAQVCEAWGAWLGDGQLVANAIRARGQRNG